jgi:hypothetical protein
VGRLYREFALNLAEEYGRLTSSSDYLRRHEQGTAVIDILGDILGNFQQVSAEQERVTGRSAESNTRQPDVRLGRGPAL